MSRIESIMKILKKAFPGKTEMLNFRKSNEKCRKCDENCGENGTDGEPIMFKCVTDHGICAC